MKYHSLFLGKPAGNHYIDDKGTNADIFFEKGLGEMRDPSQVVKALLSDTATNPALLEQLSKEVKLLKNPSCKNNHFHG